MATNPVTQMSREVLVQLLRDLAIRVDSNLEQHAHLVFMPAGKDTYSVLADLGDPPAPAQVPLATDRPSAAWAEGSLPGETQTHERLKRDKVLADLVVRLSRQSLSVLTDLSDRIDDMIIGEGMPWRLGERAQP